MSETAAQFTALTVVPAASTALTLYLNSSLAGAGVAAAAVILVCVLAQCAGGGK